MLCRNVTKSSLRLEKDMGTEITAVGSLDGVYLHIIDNLNSSGR